MPFAPPAGRDQPGPATLPSAALPRAIALGTATSPDALRARPAARWLRRAVARLQRTARALARPQPDEEERCYASALVATYGKLD